LPTLIGDKLDVKNTDSQVTMKASNTHYPWLRGGLSIGIAF